MLPELVIYLLGKNAHREGVRLTTKEMATELEVSQQTISRWMIELEQAGLIDRHGREIKLTQKAVAESERVYLTLRLALEAKRQFNFSGIVIEGLGTGKGFVKMPGYQKQFIKKLGFEAYPGTLNLKIPAGQIEQRLALRTAKPIIIEGFGNGSRRFGSLAAYKAKIFGEPAAIIFPEMSHHGLDVIELISPDNLRRRYKLAMGSGLQVLAGGGS